MRVERDVKRPGSEKLSGCCLSSATTRAVDDDVTTNPEWRAGTVFGLTDCDVCVLEALPVHFAEMQPVFKDICLTLDDFGMFMRRCAEKHHNMTTPRRMLVGSYRGDKILLAAPLLRWCLDYGLYESHVYHVIEYDPIPCFRRFGDAMSTARRDGDVHSHKAIIADTMKFPGNTGLRKDHHQRGPTS